MRRIHPHAQPHIVVLETIALSGIGSPCVQSLALSLLRGSYRSLYAEQGVIRIPQTIRIWTSGIEIASGENAGVGNAGLRLPGQCR